jgi:hypothetical protein
MQSYAYEWILRDARGNDVERIVMPASAQVVMCCLLHVALTDATQTLVSVEMPATLHIGDVLPIALTWNAAANSNWTQTIELLPIVGARPIQQSQQRIQVGASDNGAYRTLQSLQLPPTLGAGWYRLAVQRTDGQQDLHMLGMIHIEDYAPQTADIPIPQKLNAQVGEFALLGHDLVNRTWRAGDKINFNLVWQLNKKTSREGVFFVHVIGADGKPILQRDAAPFNGARSTVTFRVGDHYADSYTFTVPADAPRGKYTLYAGIYNRTDVTRWAAAQDGQPARDDLIVIAEVEVQ